MALTPLALQNADVLRELQSRSHSTVAGLGRAVGRDKDNLRKTLKGLEAAGLIVNPEGAPAGLTPAGVDALAAIERAEAPAPGPATAQPSGGVAEIALELIDTDPTLNPRTVFDEDELAALAASIADKGVAQPILVRPGLEPGRWRIVAGERRSRAARVAGLATIPAMIRDLTDDQALEIALIENIQRVDLTPLEEARAYARIIEAKRKADPDLTLKDAKEVIGEAARKTVRYVEQRMDLLELPDMDQARTLLPEGHPKHLSLTNARYAVQDLRRKERQAQERTLKPADLLVVAEVVDAMDKRPVTLSNWWSAKPAEIQWNAKGGDLKRLEDRNILDVTRNHYGDGRAYVRLGYAFDKKDVGRQLPGFSGSKRAVALHDLRSKVLGEFEAASFTDAGLYATAWLNGPFEADPAAALEIEARASQKAASEAAAAAAKAEAAALYVDAISLSERLQETASVDADYPALLERIGIPAPWTLTAKGGIRAANGEFVDDEPYWGVSAQVMAGQSMIVMAVNAAAGVATSALPPIGEEGADTVGDDDDDDQDFEDEPGDPDDDSSELEDGDEPAGEDESAEAAGAAAAEEEIPDFLRRLAGGGPVTEQAAQP